jgi:anti-sigma factor ChrR (cupin superfamily)
MTPSMWRRLSVRRDHRWAYSRLSAYIDGELPARQHRRLSAHEEICPECAELIRALEVMLSWLPALRLPPEAGLAIAEHTAEQVRARVEEWS